MTRRIGWMCLLLAGLLTAEEAPKFATLKEARAAVLERRDALLKQVERDGLVIPEQFFAAEKRRREALAAWHAKEWDEAKAAYPEAWSLYSGCAAGAKAEHARLTAMREKKPPEMRIGFKQRKAVHRALQWLAGHQDATGRWDCAGFMKHDPESDKCDGGGHEAFDVGVTALALLAFLEAGHTDRDNHYALEVFRGLQWLRAQQGPTGLFGPDRNHHYNYNHALATYVLAKAAATTKDGRLRPALEAATTFILKARAPKPGGWRYEVGGEEADTSVTTWCYRALVAARDADVAADLAAAGKGARKWLDSMTLADGRIGYNYNGNLARPEDKRRFAEDRSRSMTASGTILRLALDDEPDKKLLLKSLDRCLERPPEWASGGSIDMYYWYYGSLACRIDKKRARAWNKALHKAVLKNQHKRGARAGTWDPVGVWGAEGGRVYSTAMLALALIHAG